MRSMIKTLTLLACLGGGAWGMLTYAPDILRPNVPYSMRDWGPAKRHSVVQRQACYARSTEKVFEGFGGCLWQSVPVALWLIGKFIILSIIRATYLPAVLIGLAGGLLLWYLLVSLFGATGGRGNWLLRRFRHPMVIATAVLVATAIFATDAYRFIPIALLVFVWIVYVFAKLGQRLLREAPTH